MGVAVSVALLLVAAVAAAGDAPSGAGSGVIGGVAAGLAILIATVVFGSRGRNSIDAATGGVEGAFAFNLSPAPLLVATIAELRSLYGETAPMPRVSRTVSPAVTLGSRGLMISERKLGILISIPATDIVSVTAGPSRVTFTVPKYPSVWVRVRHAGTEVSLALPPLLDGKTIKPAKAVELAAEMSSRLGLPRA